jgi:predicted GNAT family N-acyltransferase
MMIKVIPVTTPEELAEVHRIRRIVFVEEQQCPPELEYEFEEESNHFLAYVDGAPAGAARWRATDYGFKLERFSVLQEFRGLRVGQALLSNVISALPVERKPVYLHAQYTAVGFYKKYGFIVEGEHFWEAGIEHVKMHLH